MAGSQLVFFVCVAGLSLLGVAGRRTVVSHTVAADSRGGPYCCCKEKRCEVDAKSDDETREAVYSPQHNLCCKYKSWACDSLFAFSAYTTEAPSKGFCEATQDQTFNHTSPAHEVHEIVRAEDLKPGTAEHTVHTYCDLGAGEGPEDAESEADTTSSATVKAGVAKAVVAELSKNSLDSMAKQIFSIYVCVRWAPSGDFVRAGNSEIATGKLANTSTVLEHFAANTFQPLRCTRNVNVYGGDPALGETHFEAFEAQLKSLSEWYRSEAGSTMLERLEQLQRSVGSELNSSAATFDIEVVKKAVAGCSSEARVRVNARTASAAELLGDCGAAQWWLSKLQDWHRAMPFTTMMMSDDVAAKEAHPKEGQQVLTCFGKRVASQLHRRDGGDHLMTDQSMVGCHGFWDYEMASKMLDRIVQLWRPPTCQLAAMELDMKMKIMEVTATMNSNLFDALPAMLVDEMTSEEEWDGKALEASHGIGILQGVLTSITSAFSGMRNNYARLGQLLGNTVTKWVVCPMRPITNRTELQQLDLALGTEDTLSQYYAKAAYSKWTGAKDLLPGEECTREWAEKRMPGMPNSQQCNLGVMQENMPEPYHGDEFLCPVQPLLPAKQQLDIFRQKHDLCMMRMSTPQMMKQNWFYRGHTPHRKQYNITENLPAQQYDHMKVLEIISRPDTEFGIWRSFVTAGLTCTAEEAALTPRWCRPPEVVNVPLGNLLGAIGGALGGMGAGAVRAGLQAGGVMEETPSNEARGERLGQWLYGQLKGWEKWIKSSGEWVGRASTRYERQYSRAFVEVEANELLHSASFQVQMNKTGGDSKDRAKFDRYAVVAPCEDFDPAREFRLKYSWSEKAISLARKAHNKFGGVLSAGAFRVQLRGEGVLSMKDEENAWMTYYTHLRAASVDGALPEWIATENPYLQEMSGALDGGGSSVSAGTLLGFQATFVCGTRVDMHNLPIDFEGREGDFSSCVKEGKEKNEELRAKYAGERFIKEETVIRVTFAPLLDCYREVSSSSVQNANETKNPVFESFMSVQSCKTTVPAAEVPDDLKDSKSQYNYRGMLLGKGLPTETLTEVLVDPKDFLMEVSL